MSLDCVHREQAAHRCACVALSSRDCLRRRYPQSCGLSEWEDDVHDYDPDERCECSCQDDEQAEHGEDCGCPP